MFDAAAMTATNLMSEWMVRAKDAERKNRELTEENESLKRRIAFLLSEPAVIENVFR